jgi:hypothetical protein
MDNKAVFYTFQSLTSSATEDGGQSCQIPMGRQFQVALSTTSSTSSGRCSSQPQGLHLSSTIGSNYRVRPLPVIPFLVNNNKRCQTAQSEQNARTRRVNKRRWAGPNVASEDEPMSTSSLSLSKRPRHHRAHNNHRAHDHHRTSSTHTSTASLMEIDLIVSHVLGYLSWREQLHCRSVSKVWREAYLSAPTRFLLDTAGSSSSPPSPSLPRVLQPSPLDRFHNQISWISMTRIGSVTTKLILSTTTTNALKRISRLDIYGSPGGDSSFRRHPNSGSNHRQALHTMQILNHITIHPSFLVEELRLLYINRDDLNRYLNKYSHQGLVGYPALGDSGPLPPL